MLLVDQETIDNMKGKKDRELFKEILNNREKMVLTGEQQEKFRIAADILEQNKKDCEKFKGRIDET